MPKVLELPEPLEAKLDKAAEREGVSPNDHIAFWLYIIDALQKGNGQSTPFERAVQSFFSHHALDPDRITSVLAELVQYSLAPTGAGKTLAAFSIAFSLESEQQSKIVTSLPYAALTQWRNATVHNAFDASFDQLVNYLPALDRIGQVAGRVNRVGEQANNVSVQKEWPENFIENTYGSLTDDPIDLVPHGQDVEREPIE